MKIQTPYKCKKYKPNSNLNLTCDNCNRCVIYYDEVCNEYKEKKEILSEEEIDKALENFDKK